MPLFEYKCNECGSTFELWQQIATGRESVHCPSCGQGHPQRLLSTFATAAGKGNLSVTEPSSCSTCCSTGTCPF